jgi:hypothetical protein
VHPRRLLTLTTPVVHAWASWQAARGHRRGRPLSQAEREVAMAVGVSEPERVRLMLVDRVPIPGTAWLERIARRLDLPGPDVDGLTLGETIFIRRTALSLALLAHECRHVRQYEAAGTLGRFLRLYLQEVARHGYHDAPMEADAREAAGQWARSAAHRGRPGSGASG